MSEGMQEQEGGMSKSEKAMLVRAIVTGAFAVVTTLWLDGVFDAGSPVAIGLVLILACLLSFIVAVSTSVMSENAIEDIVKIVLFALPWLIIHFMGQHESFELITLGMLIGSVAGFLGNRLPEKERRHP